MIILPTSSFLGLPKAVRKAIYPAKAYTSILGIEIDVDVVTFKKALAGDEQAIEEIERVCAAQLARVPRSAPTIEQLTNFAVAATTGALVPTRIRKQREAVCRGCDMVRWDEQRRPWCNVCGCGVSNADREIRNLAAYVENLPRWGCKHPKRGPGVGWAQWTPCSKEEATAALRSGKLLTLDQWEALPENLRKTTPSPDDGLTPGQLSSYFDRVWVVTMARTPYRLEQFQRRMTGLKAAGDWPFPDPQVFPAVDGGLLPVPEDWKVGQPAWGCHCSHETILRDALLSGCKRILVLEDDVGFVPGFASKIGKFLARVPEDWDQLMIGGQQMDDGFKREEVPGVYRVSQHERTHAYAVQGDGMRSLYRKWISVRNGHCDWTMGDWQTDNLVYAPETPLAIQVENISTIRGMREPSRGWHSDLAGAKRSVGKIPAVNLRVPRELLETLINRGLVHLGFSRRPDGMDTGLPKAMAAVGTMEKFVDARKKEAIEFEQAVVAIWEPENKWSGLSLPVVEGTELGPVAKELRRIRLASEGLPIPEENLHVFYHIACMGNWREVVAEQAECLVKAGLTRAVCGVLGSKEDSDLAQAIAQSKGLTTEVAYRREELGKYEIPTLTLVHNWAKTSLEHGAALYIHTKGVSRPESGWKAMWRRLMMYGVAARWQTNLDALQTHDVSGILWNEGGRHFVGNFWVARRDFLEGLPSPEQYSLEPRGNVFGGPWRRMSAECWIGHSPEIPPIVNCSGLSDTSWLGWDAPDSQLTPEHCKEAVAFYPDLLKP